MSTQPREAMRAIYLYIVTFIGLVFILVGAYAIVDFVFDSIFQLEVRNPNRLWSGALTQIVVGAALLLSHWKLAFFSKK